MTGEHGKWGLELIFSAVTDRIFRAIYSSRPWGFPVKQLFRLTVSF